MALFSRLEFLEFFDKEEIDIIEDVLYNYTYKSTINEFTIQLYINYENEVLISLKYQDVKTPIFTIRIDDLDKILIKDKRILEFYKKGSENPLIKLLAKDRIWLDASL